MALQSFSCQFCSPAVDLTLSLALPSPAPPQAMTLQPCLCQSCSPVDYLTLALRSPAPPQGDVVALAQLWRYWLLRGAGAGRQGAAAAADDGQARLENGHTGADNNPERWPLMIVNAENHLFNEKWFRRRCHRPAPMEAENDGRVGEKRRRAPAPVEGSQCRRSNGKRWRCKEQAQGGYGFCEEHRRQDRERCADTRARRRHAAALAKAKATAAAPEAGV